MAGDSTRNLMIQRFVFLFFFTAPQLIIQKSGINHRANNFYPFR